MKGFIVGIKEEDSRSGKRFNILFVRDGGTKFSKAEASEERLVKGIKSGEFEFFNVKIGENGDTLQGRGASLSRFGNNKTLVVISALIKESNNNTVGYRVCDNVGNVKTIRKDDLLKYCGKMKGMGIIPLQNMIYVGESSDVASHIREYDESPLVKEIIQMNKKEVKREIKESKDRVSSTDKVANVDRVSSTDEIVSTDKKEKFDDRQISILKHYKNIGVKIDKFAKADIPADNMAILGLMEADGGNVEEVIGKGFNTGQLMQIALGDKSGVDIHKYADVKISAKIMEKIRLKLEDDLYRSYVVDAAILSE